MTALPRPLGVVYTPASVTRPMVELALAPLVETATASQLLALRICDPAIGKGAFLVEIVRVLADALERRHGARHARRRVAERCVFGADIDAHAVAEARAAVERFVGEPVPALRDHLRVADALATDWPAPFDALIANPPYVRQERIGAAAKRALRDYAVYDGVADLYVYFVELALRIARRYCMVIPNKWLTAAYGRPLRALLAECGGLERVVDLGHLPVFADADAFPCIIAGTPGRSAAPVKISRADNAATSVVQLLAAPGVALQGVGAEPWHMGSRSAGALVERLAARWPSLGSTLAEPPARGVVTGCNRAFVVDRATRDRLVARDPAARAWLRPFAKGRDVRRWRLAPADRYLVLVDRGADPPRAIRDHLAPLRAQLEPRPRDHAGAWSGRKPGAYRWFELQDPVGALARARRPRLFYQDIQSAPACCLDPSGALVPDTTVWVLASDDRFLLALLNSRLYGWYARLRFPPALGGAVRPKQAYMRVLPVAAPPPDLRARIAALVDAQLATPPAGEHGAATTRDAELDTLICDAYELSRRERLLLQR